MIATLGDEDEREECRQLTEMLSQADEAPEAVNFATEKPVTPGTTPGTR